MNRARAFRVLWFGQFSSVAGLTVVVPLLPLYLAGLGTAPAQVPVWTGMALAAPAAAQIVSGPLWGAVGDRWGRKNMVVRAYLGLALAVGLMALAETPGQFLACRVLQGVCGGVVAATTAYATTLAPERRRGRALGSLFSATAVGSLLGPLLGGLMSGRLGFSALFLAVAVLLTGATGLAAVTLREPPHPGHPTAGTAGSTGLGEAAATVAVLLASRAGRAMSAAGLCAQAGVFGLVVVFAPQVEDVSVSLTAAMAWVGALQAITWAGSAVGSGWWGRRHDRLDPAGGFALAAAGCAVAVGLQGLPVGPELLAPMRVLQGLCFAALVPAVLHVATRLAPPERHGAMTGVTTGVLDLGQVVGPLLGALLAVLLPLPAVFPALAGLFGLAAVLALSARSAATRMAVPDPATPGPEVRR